MNVQVITQHNGNGFALTYLHSGKVDFCLPTKYDKVKLLYVVIRKFNGK